MEENELPCHSTGGPQATSAPDSVTRVLQGLATEETKALREFLSPGRDEG